MTSGAAGKGFETAVGGPRNLVSSGLAFCISGKVDPAELSRQESKKRMETEPNSARRPQTAAFPRQMKRE